MYLEPRKKLEDWKIRYTRSRSEWSSSRDYHDISALTLATTRVSHIRKPSHLPYCLLASVAWYDTRCLTLLHLVPSPLHIGPSHLQLPFHRWRLVLCFIRNSSGQQFSFHVIRRSSPALCSYHIDIRWVTLRLWTPFALALVLYCFSYVWARF